MVLQPGRNNVELKLVCPLPGVFRTRQISMCVGRMRLVHTPPAGLDHQRDAAPTPSGHGATTAPSPARRGDRSTSSKGARDKKRQARAHASDADEDDVLVVAQRRDPILLFWRQPPCRPARYCVGGILPCVDVRLMLVALVAVGSG